MTTPPADQLNDQSVTRYDSLSRREDDPVPAPGVLTLFFPSSRSRTVDTLPIDLPPRWSRRRDYILQSAPDHCDLWAGAMGKAITKIIARGWRVEDKAQSAIRTKRAQAILNNANKGKGWAHFLGQHLADYLQTDNGAFVEVIWSSLRVRRDRHGALRPIGRVLGIQHLDSVRCTRLMDDDLAGVRDVVARHFGIFPHEVNATNFPVLYTDFQGRGHLLWRHQVFDVVDEPSARIEHRGTGRCATSRAYHTIYQSAAMERYFSEKVSGERVQEIHLVSGISANQVEQSLSSAAEQQRARGYERYRGVVMIPSLKLDAPISGYRIPISEVPDAFAPKEERTEHRLKIAAALGIPPRDLEPAPAGLNSGATALIEAERVEGQGLAAWDAAFARCLNDRVLPYSTEFGWEEGSIRDEKAVAEVRKLRAETRKIQIESGEITAAQALQMAVDDEDVPSEFLPADETAQDELSDDEKPNEAPAEEEIEEGEPLTIGDLLGWARKAEDDDTWDDAVTWAKAALHERG